MEKMQESSASSAQTSDLAERVTVRELIRRRLEEAIKYYSNLPIQNLKSFIEERKTEVHSLPPNRETPDDLFNIEAQLATACTAFEARQLIMIVGSKQANSLDEEFMLTEGTNVQFLKSAVIRWMVLNG